MLSVTVPSPLLMNGERSGQADRQTANAARHCASDWGCVQAPGHAEKAVVTAAKQAASPRQRAPAPLQWF